MRGRKPPDFCDKTTHVVKYRMKKARANGTDPTDNGWTWFTETGATCRQTRLFFGKEGAEGGIVDVMRLRLFRCLNDRRHCERALART